MLTYHLLFDKKNLIKQLLKVKNKYSSLLAKIIRLKPNKILEILADSYFMDRYGATLHNSELIIPGPLLQKEREGDFIRLYSNLQKKLISGDKMSKYHSEEVLLQAKQGQGLFSDEVKKKFGTIFTPDFVVDKCLDLAWKYYKGDKLKATYCDPACYSADTEVFTNHGWKLFKDVLDDDLIYSFNKQLSIAEYVPFIARQVNDYSGKMHHYHGKRIDILVTTDHQMFIQNRLCRVKHNGHLVASDVLYKNNQRGNKCALVGSAYLPVNDCKRGWTVDHYRLFGMWLGDGYLFKNNNKKPNAIGFGFNKQRKINFVISCLDRMNFTYTTNTDKNGKTWIRIVNKELLDYLIPLDGTRNKFIPDEIIYSNRECLEALVDGLINSDGHTSTNNKGGFGRFIKTKFKTRHYYTTNKKLFETIQQVLIHLGIIIYVKERSRMIKGSMITTYEITCNKGNRFSLPSRSVREVDYAGKTYCLTLAKNHIMLVRRNGRSVFCGNCGDANFLIATYDRLMKEESDLPKNLLSKHIIEHCLWGFDIIDGMIKATKVALFDKHCSTCGDDFVPIEKWNIYHGNTIVVEKDIEQDWYGEREEWEGGILPKEIREKKFDVIISNPPYTHLRNLNNRRYAAYPKQRDLAQVFVRWALDHMTEDGVVSYNISSVWLNVKICDGAKETRELIGHNYGLDITNNRILQDYSSGSGGNLATMIMIIHNNHNKLIYNNMERSKEDLLSSGFINSLDIISVNFPFISTTMKPYIIEKGSHKCGGDIIWDEIKLIKTSMPYLVIKYVLTPKSYFGGFKLYDQIKDCSIGSEVIYVKMNYTHGLWCIGYLNTKLAYKYVDLYTKRLTGAGYKAGNCRHRFSVQLISSMVIPDFDYYKENHPQRFKKYIKWIEDNMYDKDKFLKGVDVEFNSLIK